MFYTQKRGNVLNTSLVHREKWWVGHILVAGAQVSTHGIRDKGVKNVSIL